jgi:hypothetical protein
MIDNRCARAAVNRLLPPLAVGDNPATTIARMSPFAHQEPFGEWPSKRRVQNSFSTRWARHPRFRREFINALKLLSKGDVSCLMALPFVVVGFFPVLLSITTTAALGFGHLFMTRPNAGELGAICVVVTDDNGKSGNAIRVVVAEAPLVQKDTISPGSALSDTVHYPVPYLTKPNLKLSSSNRQYGVIAETEFEFTWIARLLPDDLRDGTPKDSNMLDELFGGEASLASLKGALKPGLTFEDFTWEAKGLRAPPSSIPTTFEQTGSFYSEQDREGTEFFPIPYDSPPHIELSETGPNYPTIILECTAKSFKWRNTSRIHDSGSVTWKAKGIRSARETK